MHFEFEPGGKPNAWGLYDVHGQVWEWCDGGMRGYTAQAQTDPPNDRRSESAVRVLRGGSWSDSPRRARAAYRDEYPREDNWLSAGFRFALRSSSTGQ